MIMSQTKIFTFLPGSVHTSSIQRTLSFFASRYSNNYITTRNIWINQLYFDISNSKVKQCLTVDARDVNDLGQENLEHKPTVGQSKYAIIIEIKKIPPLSFFGNVKRNIIS